ncbi:flavin reductase family protein, partial [Streptomyces millisiae]
VHWLESLQGLPTRAQLSGFTQTVFARSTGFEAFICGPAPFMAVIKETLTEAGVPRERIHLEVFQSLSGDPFTDDTPTVATDSDDRDTAALQVDLDGTSHRLRWPRQATLVDVLIRSGVDVPYSCKEGQCGSCAATV